MNFLFLVAGIGICLTLGDIPYSRSLYLSGQPATSLTPSFPPGLDSDRTMLIGEEKIVPFRVLKKRNIAFHLRIRGNHL